MSGTQKDFDYYVINCRGCGTENTIARTAQANTLARWDVVQFPQECYCPECSTKPRTERKDEQPVSKRGAVKSHKNMYYRITTDGKCKYYGVLTYLGKAIYTGFSDTIDEAAKLIDAKGVELWGAGYIPCCNRKKSKYAKGGK